MRVFLAVLVSFTKRQIVALETRCFFATSVRLRPARRSRTIAVRSSHLHGNRRRNVRCSHSDLRRHHDHHAGQKQCVATQARQCRRLRKELSRIQISSFQDKGSGLVVSGYRRFAMRNTVTLDRYMRSQLAVLWLVTGRLQSRSNGA